MAAQRLHMNRDNSTIVMVNSRLYIYNLNEQTWTQLTSELIFTADMEENFVMGSVGTLPSYLLAFAPGATDTPLLLPNTPAGERSDAREELFRQASQQIPLGRLAHPAEIANAVTWLLSGEASYVTGSHLVCDGGLMAKSANTF